MGRNALGELEHLVLVAVVRLGEGAYGAAIIEEIEAHTERELSHAATYIALQRLEGKGLLESEEDAPEPGRGGRARRYFTVTDDGLGRLRESASALFGMWQGVDPVLRGEVDT